MLFLSLLPSHCRHETLHGGDVIATEGETLALDCTFETSDNKRAYLFWYKQEVNDFPKFMLQRNSYAPGNNAEEFPKEKFDAQINDTSVPLTILKLQPSDSALYYCAGLNSERKLQKHQGTSSSSFYTLFFCHSTCCYFTFCCSCVLLKVRHV
uniref:Ig-like domain-containing protein n=1 Tax=Myripristis murdjan TaxID=586833 RepID=A0A667WCU3_9TELE